MRAGRILRQIVIARISDQVPALTGVYDRATESRVYPYVTLGPSYWTDDSAECIEAREITLQVDLWAEAGKGATEDILDDVATALNGWTDQTALTLHPLRVSLVRLMDDPSGAIHGVIQIEALVEA